jgi:hypothetical protein
MNLREYKDFLTRMNELTEKGDTEANHGQADAILCEVLDRLGYTELVVEYDKVEKWYG